MIVKLCCKPLALVLIFSCAAIAQSPPAAERVIVIRAGTLIDGVANEARHDQVIVVRGNRIASVGSAAASKIPQGADVVDLSHATVLPGMIDAHTHIYLQGEDPAKGGYDVNLLNYSLAYRAARAAVSARRALEQGFTTIRDLETEGAGYGDLGIKQAIAEGDITGAPIFGAGRAISTTGGYPLDGYGPELQDILPKGVQIVDGPVQARKDAREQLANGVEWVKVYLNHNTWE